MPYVADSFERESQETPNGPRCMVLLHLKPLSDVICAGLSPLLSARLATFTPRCLL